MSTNANPYVVNIVPLQGIASGITSAADTTSQITAIQTNVANLQAMVNFTTGTISADYITSLTQGNTIQVIEDINLSSVSLYSNGSAVTFGSPGTLSTIRFTSLSTNNSFISGTNSSVSMTVAGNPVLQIASSSSRDPTASVNITGALNVSGNASVQSLFQTSDRSLKTNIQPFSTSLDSILKLEPCSFKWIKTGEQDLGFIAQDVQGTWPSLSDGKTIAYSRFIPLLLEGLRELSERVSTLEAVTTKEGVTNTEGLRN